MTRGNTNQQIPVVYASNSGNTRDGAQLIAAELTAAGQAAEAVSVSKLSPSVAAKAPFIVIGSCSWLRQTAAGPTEGEIPEFMHSFVQRLVQQPGFQGTQVAIFGFGRHEYTHFCGAVDKLETILSGAGAEMLVDSLRVDGFFVQNEEPIRAWAAKLSHQLADRPQLA